jgi:hypothetical protein
MSREGQAGQAAGLWSFYRSVGRNRAKPYVLDRDHRLVREDGDEIDLLECAHLVPHQCDSADRHPFPHQRNTQHCANAADNRLVSYKCKLATPRRSITISR